MRQLECPRQDTDTGKIQRLHALGRALLRAAMNLSAEHHKLRLLAKVPWSQLVLTLLAGWSEADGFCLCERTIW